MIKHTQEWYASWFDTPFYHILYKDRGHEEAQQFMDKLTGYLNLPEEGKVLDLACGRGRHSIYLNSLGYRVTGVDLSEKSIAYAKQFENETLNFQVHDMCKPFNDMFDAVFNLFTSFGYFENEDDNLKTIKAIKADLNDTGFGVIDFMNVHHVIEHLVPEDKKMVEGIEFTQRRYVEDGHIIKDIRFNAGNESFMFKERVKALTLDDFIELFDAAGVYLLDVFGDYQLRRYNQQHSERLIMIFK